jgi:hypothetical protein
MNYFELEPGITIIGNPDMTEETKAALKELFAVAKGQMKEAVSVRVTYGDRTEGPEKRLPITQVYQCVVCEVCYNRYNKARDCCVKVRTLEQCDYCEELFSTWHAAAGHPIDRQCPREIENEK